MFGMLGLQRGAGNQQQDHGNMVEKGSMKRQHRGGHHEHVEHDGVCSLPGRLAAGLRLLRLLTGLSQLAGTLLLASLHHSRHVGQVVGQQDGQAGLVVAVAAAAGLCAAQAGCSLEHQHANNIQLT